MHGVTDLQDKAYEENTQKENSDASTHLSVNRK
jgi:hypothetical protein